MKTIRRHVSRSVNTPDSNVPAATPKPDSPYSERFASFSPVGKQQCDDRETCWRGESFGDALQDSANEKSLVVCETCHQRGHDKAAGSQQEHATMTKVVAQTSPEEQEPSGGEKGAVHHPYQR